MPNSNYSELFWLFGEIGSKVPIFFSEHAQQMFSCAELPLHSDPGVYHFLYLTLQYSPQQWSLHTLVCVI